VCYAAVEVSAVSVTAGSRFGIGYRALDFLAVWSNEIERDVFLRSADLLRLWFGDGERRKRYVLCFNPAEAERQRRHQTRC
jgi:hypothetical protein